MEKVLLFCAICLMNIFPFTSKAMDDRDTHQQVRKLTLIAEAHSVIGGIKSCHQMMRNKPKEKKLNFFIERDNDRLQWAREEAQLLTFNSEEDFFMNHDKHRSRLSRETDRKIYNIIASESMSGSEREGRIRNRFWLLKILREFGNNPKINIIPCDASVMDVISYFKSANQIQNLGLLKFHVEIVEEKPDDCQGSIDEIMQDSRSLKPRNITINNIISQNVEVDAWNIALLGLVHAGWVYSHLPSDINITPYKTKFPEDDLEKEKNQPGVKQFLADAK